jgi:hypothetical protein
MDYCYYLIGGISIIVGYLYIKLKKELEILKEENRRLIELLIGGKVL